jgi:type II secretion system (T2SS) protein E
MRIGEFLVQKSLINKNQLKEALEAQLIFGGHLGTCLMERGHLAERQLGRVLAEMLGVEYAPPEFFDKIPRTVVDLLPEKLVERHRAIPFRLQERTLDTAMVDPQDLAARDALSFASGYKIRPWVAPEARVLQAMERYYGIRRSVRYVTLCKDTEQARPAPNPREVSSGQESRPAPQTAPAARATSVAEPMTESDLLATVSQELLRAESVDHATELVVSHASRTLERCLLMLVKSNRALPWQGGGWPCDPKKWSHLSFAVTSEPIFSLLSGEDLYRGPVPREPEYLRFYRTLEMESPEEAILLPAYLDDRLVALFYGDGGPHDKVLGEDNYYRRLVRKFGIALNLVESRRKLVSA